MSELKTSLKLGGAKLALSAAGGGAGLAIGIAAIKGLMQRPEFLPQIVNGGGLGFAAMVVGIVVLRAELRDFNATQRLSAVAQQELAANVGAMISNQSQERRETDLLVNHMARTHEKISVQYGEILGRLDELKGLHSNREH